MLTSLALIFLLGFSLAAICEKIHLPRIVGMLVAGIVLGPFVLDLLDESVLGISSELRRIALIVILIKAGLSLNTADLKKIGRPALLMSFVPASFEILGYVLLAPRILGVTHIEAALMGAVLGAVSPAVVVPRMIKLIDEGYGTEKGIPQMIMAGASCDDVFVIVLFSSFLGMVQGGGIRAADFLKIPVSIILGTALGAAAGYALSKLFELTDRRGGMKCGVKLLIMLSSPFLLMTAEDMLREHAAISGLLGVIAMASVINKRSPAAITKELSAKFGELWLAAEVLLFVLVGAAVDIRYAAISGAAAVLMIFTALLFRALGVVLCMVKTPLSAKERLFCVAAYLPKATVQAAIGSVPLSAGLSSGNIILSVAVLAIIITAPLGALGIDLTYKKLLTRESKE